MILDIHLLQSLCEKDFWNILQTVRAFSLETFLIAQVDRVGFIWTHNALGEKIAEVKRILRIDIILEVYCLLEPVHLGAVD